MVLHVISQSHESRAVRLEKYKTSSSFSYTFPEGVGTNEYSRLGNFRLLHGTGVLGLLLLSVVQIPGSVLQSTLRSSTSRV